MATINWHDNRTLKQHMLLQHGDFNVFQLLRLLSNPAASSLPVEHRLRFKADLSSAFPAREFSKLVAHTVLTDIKDEKQVEEVIEISTANFCVASVLGPLPEPFTEWVRELVGERMPAMADFFDIFNQRINVLRFELKQQQILALNNQAPADTNIAQALAALMGLGIPELAGQVPLPKRAWLGLAGLLANRRKNATTVEHVLQLVLQARVTLTPLVGGWQSIEAQDTTRLGLGNHQLGQKTILGQQVWDQQARVRLDIEPLDYPSACELLPQATNAGTDNIGPPGAFARFSALLLLLLDGLADCEVVLHIVENTIPPAWLPPSPTTVTVTPRAMCLGQNAFLFSRQSIQQTLRSVSYLLRADDMMGAV